MPGSGKYTTYDPLKQNVGKGTSSVDRLKKLFNPPPELTDTKKLFEIANAKLLPKTPQAGDPSQFKGGVDLTFSQAPDLTGVQTGGGGLPSSPYTPNRTSPGEKSGVNAVGQQDEGIKDIKELSTTAQLDVDGLKNPSKDSKTIGSSIVIDDTAASLKPGVHPGGT